MGKKNYNMGTDEHDKSSDKNDIQEIERLLSTIAKTFTKKKNDKKKKNLHPQTLNSLIEEYLGAYVLIGYDINDNYIQLSNISTQGEHDKLQTALHRLLRTGLKVRTDITDFDDDFDE